MFRPFIRRKRRAPSAVALLVGALLVVLPVLAVLQYRWLGQLSAAQHERLQQTLRASVDAFERSLELEVLRIVIGLPVDAASLETPVWDRYGERIAAWQSAALAPRLVSGIWLVDGSEHEGAPLRLRYWEPAEHAFVDVPWPAALEPVRAGIERFRRDLHSDEGAAFGGADDALGDDSILVLPVLSPPASPSAAGRDLRLAFTLIAIDDDVLRREVLPALVERHFGVAGASDYHLAIVSQLDPRQVVFEAQPGDARLLAVNADISEPVVAVPRPRFGIRRDAQPGLMRFTPAHRAGTVVFGARLPNAGTAPTSVMTAGLPVAAQIVTNVERARWQLRMRHRAGSLEAAVDGVRRRNMAIGFGLLLMVGASAALMVVAARRAQRLGAQQIEFVAAVSHELRTPVSVLASAGDNLAQGLVDHPARVREYGAAIRTEARRLGETVERVLGFAGIQAGRVTGHRVPVAVRQVVDDAVVAAEPVTRAQGVEVTLDMPGELPPVLADPAALRSALENLIVNGARYAASGGVLTITAEAGADGRRPEVRVRVADRGPGIPAAERARVFEPFYRGADAQARGIHGSGLGLSIVKRIAEAHGGRATLESRIGEGSTFTLHLPALTTLAPHGLAPAGRG